MKIISRKDAKVSGLKYYFTGKPCKRGHLCERHVRDKNCRECKVLLRDKWFNDRPGYHKTYYINNSAKAKARAFAWSKKNPERARQRIKDFHVRNPDYAAEKQRIYIAKNREKKRSWTRNRRAKVRMANGSHTEADVFAILERQNRLCVYCESDISETYEVDHRMPIAKGGTNDPSNLQMLCRPCNRRKSDIHPDEYERLLKVEVK
jgi:5-methylcytosine-specific restriction endonuclease McrA